MSTGVAFTARDDAFLCKHYPSMGATYCARKLGRTAASIGARTKRLGLSRLRESLPKPPRSKPAPIIKCAADAWAPPVRYASVFAMAQGVQA